MSIPKESKVVIINENPEAEITKDTFRFETQPLPELKDGQVLVQVVALSNDPAQRPRIQAGGDIKRHYVTPQKAGEVMAAAGLGKVIASKSSKFKEGQTVSGPMDWREYTILDEASINGQAANIEGQSPYLSISLLGSIGLTAYTAAFEEMKLKADQSIVISGAAGAVGSVLVQIAKNIIGCKKVIGIAGGKEKCDWVKSLGADDCVDYKSSDWKDRLTDIFSEEYCDIYFDNVGGETLDTMLKLVKRYGYICVCGAISGYHGEGFQYPNWGQVVYNRLTLRGFLVLDHHKAFPKAIGDLTQWLKEGKIKWEKGEDVVEGAFDDIPDIWQRLFKGQNKGKLITKLNH